VEQEYKAELGNLLDNLKIDIINSLSSQLKILHTKRKKEEVELALAIFYSEFQKKHPLTKFPLNNVEVLSL